MKKITVSAPGKLMLFGEHAVVYGRLCIVTAVDQRMEATVELTNQPIFQLNAPNVEITDYQKPMSDLGQSDIPKGAKFVEIAIKNFISSFPTGGGIKVTTSSQFSSKFGFGSSSASTVCVIFALSKILGINLDQKAIFDLCYKTVLDIQGVGSGFDIAAAIYGGTLLYLTGGKVIETIKISSLPLIVGYTGIKADTTTIVKETQKRVEKYPQFYNGAFDLIEEISLNAKPAMLKKDYQTLGELMNINQGYLEAMEVSSNKLSNLIYAARDTGAYGAKLSGAGIGDCMIAIAPPYKIKAVENSITKAGGHIIKIKTNAQGVRIES